MPAGTNQRLSTLLVVALAAFVTGALPARHAATQDPTTYTLANDRGTATFDARGLAAIDDRTLDKRLALTRDAFSVAIDGRRLESDAPGSLLPPAGRPRCPRVSTGPTARAKNLNRF